MPLGVEVAGVLAGEDVVNEGVGFAGGLELEVAVAVFGGRNELRGKKVKSAK